MYKWWLLSICYIIIFTSCTETVKHKQHSSAFASEIDLNNLGKTKQPVVIFFINIDCPICKKYQGSFKSILANNKDFARFYFVIEGEASESAIKEFCIYDSIPLKNVLIDNTGEIAETFGATVTPQVKILDGAGFNFVYSGLIDDRFPTLGSQKQIASINFVEKTLISLQNHEPVEISETTPVGCFIEPE